MLETLRTVLTHKMRAEIQEPLRPKTIRAIAVEQFEHPDTSSREGASETAGQSERLSIHPLFAQRVPIAGEWGGAGGGRGVTPGVYTGVAVCNHTLPEHCGAPNSGPATIASAGGLEAYLPSRSYIGKLGENLHGSPRDPFSTRSAMLAVRRRRSVGQARPRSCAAGS